MSYTARIDKRSCQSSGNCVEMLPEAFGFDADELGDVKEGVAGLGRTSPLPLARSARADRLAARSAPSLSALDSRELARHGEAARRRAEAAGRLD